jgi:hypothetical protein
MKGGSRGSPPSKMSAVLLGRAGRSSLVRSRDDEGVGQLDEARSRRVWETELV